MAYVPLQQQQSTGGGISPHHADEEVPATARPPSTVSSLSEQERHQNRAHDLNHFPPAAGSDPNYVSPMAEPLSLDAEISGDPYSHKSDQGPWDPSRRSRRRQCTPWILELGALLLAVAALVSAAVVLASYDGKALDEWRFATSINTIISTLGVISKASLAFAVSASIGQHKWNWFRERKDELHVFERFDEASRGPWGSINLLLWSRARNWAVLGALVTILTLFVDPFLQATVSIQGQNVAVESTSRLPVAHNIDVGQMYYDLGGPLEYDEEMIPIDLFDVVPDFGLTGALYDGFYRTSLGAAADNQTVRSVCGTGNCTWPLFTTAAICSLCKDVPQGTIVKTSGVSWNNEGTDADMPDNAILANASYTSYNLSYGHIKQFNGPRGSQSSEPVLLTASMHTNYSRSISFQDLNTTFAVFLIMRAADDFLHQNASWEDSWPVATECGLHFCAEAYRSTATNGLLAEAKVGTWAIREPRSWKAADHPLAMPGWAPTLQGWDSHNPTFDRQAHLRTDLQVIIPEQELGESGIAVTKTFNITQTTVMGIQSIIYDTLGSDFIVYPRSSSKSTVANILWNSTNLSTTFDYLAHRLTVQIRDTSDVTHAGQAERYIVYIKVNWWFLSLLILSLTSGSIYFAAVLLQTYRLGLPVWKGSVYPALASGFDEGTQSLLRKADQNMNRSPAVQRFRNKIIVRLQDTEDGHRLQTDP